MAPLPYECGHSSYGPVVTDTAVAGPPGAADRQGVPSWTRAICGSPANPPGPGGTTSPPAAGFPGASLRSQQMTSPVRLGRERGDAPCGRRRRCSNLCSNESNTTPPESSHPAESRIFARFSDTACAAPASPQLTPLRRLRAPDRARVTRACRRDWAETATDRALPFALSLRQHGKPGPKPKNHAVSALMVTKP